MFSTLAPGWPARPPEVRWGLREAFICLVGAQIAAVFWAASSSTVFSQFGLDDKTIAFLVVGNLGLWLGYFIGPRLVSKALGQGPRIDFDIGVSLREAGLAVAFGIIMQLVVLPALYWPINRLTDQDPGESAQALVDKVNGPTDVLLLALAVVLVAPVVEERFYRGLLLPALTASIGPLFGIIGSSFIFALVHQELIVMPGLMLLAALLAWMTASTGRIGPAIVTHMAFNAVTVVQLLALS